MYERRDCLAETDTVVIILLQIEEDYELFVHLNIYLSYISVIVGWRIYVYEYKFSFMF